MSLKVRQATVIALVLAVMLMMGVVGSSRTSAYNLFGGRWPYQPSSGCCANFLLYITPGMYGEDNNAFNHGMGAWTSSPANVNWQSTSNSSNSIVGESTYNNSVSWLAQTTLIPCFSCQYSNAAVQLNDYYTLGYTDAHNQSIAAHELGHVMGLDHHTGRYLMNPTDPYALYSINTPQTDDVNGVNALY